MPRVRNWQAISNPVPALIIWLISALTFYILFQMALRNSTPSSSTGWSLSNVERRTKLYDELSRELDVKGAAFLKNGETSQSLSLSDLFTVKNGAVTPVLRAANPPVRANVLYMSPQYSLPVAEAVQKVFMPYFDKVIWFQNSTLYHFSMFHASHHITPVTASEVEIEAEANAVKAVAKDVCPLKISLDRVVLTSTGVLLGCWQVISGLDPAVLRDRLRSALPQAPAIQLEQKISELQFLHELVNELNRKLRGFQATISELWYVEEYDLLALALNGRVKARKFQLSCSKT